MTDSTTAPATSGKSCPQCGSGEFLRTIETLQGTCRFTTDGTTFDYSGYTRVEWETSDTIGVLCTACGFEHESPGGMSEADILAVLI